MIRTLAFLVAAALAVAGAVWLADHPGSVTFVWQDWQIETSATVAALAVLVLAGLVALLYRLWRAIRGAPRAFADARRQSRRESGYRALTQGMVAVAAGDAEEARRQARQADKLLGDPPLTMLLSAQAAQLGGDEAAARTYFTRMLERPETAFLGLRGLLMQAQRAGDRTAALGLARRAYEQRPKTPWVLTTLFDLQLKAGRWGEALATLEEAIRRGAVDRAIGQRRRAVVLLGCSRAAEAEGDAEAALDYARRAEGQGPDFLPAKLRVGALLLGSGHKRRAGRIIADGWRHAPHPELARLYAALEPAEEPLDRVRRFEKLLSLNPDHPESHIALAEALLAARLWGAARTHLDRAGGAAAGARACRLMADLAEGESGDMAAARQWLLDAARAVPDPVWLCTECGAPQGEWLPLCPRCEALGSIEWRSPPRSGELVLQPADMASPSPATAAVASGGPAVPSPPPVSAPGTGGAGPVPPAERR